MTKKQRAAAIIELLEQEYPLADCTLDYDEAWKLLVSVRLAAQCTDARVNVVVGDWDWVSDGGGRMIWGRGLKGCPSLT